MEMQHSYTACSMDMDMQHENMDMQHGHGHATWIWTCNMDMGMQHRYENAAWIWAYSARAILFSNYNVNGQKRQQTSLWKVDRPYAAIIIIGQQLPLFNLKLILAVRVS